jgi:hypothetical protein
MTPQHELTEVCELHGPDGHLLREGWARRPLWRYRRAKVPASSWRIKEWDYYAVVSPDGWALGLTASNLGYVGVFAIAFMDLKQGRCWQVDDLQPLPLARHAFPEVAADGEIHFSSRKVELHFTTKNDARVLRFASQALAIEGEITLAPPSGDSLTIATSWAENRRAFYHNTKLNCLKASGRLRFGEREFALDPERELAVLDWGRGVWTYRNTWYWSSASGYLDGVPFGFNLGYGFSDRTPASENLLIYDGVGHKLDQVTFHFDRRDWLKPWRVSSNDGRLELSFRPAVDRNNLSNLLLIRSEQHQVFGYFSGEAVLDDGRRLTLTDFPGFAEEVQNRW